MARFLGLIVGALLVFACLFVSSIAFALYPDEGAAFSACEALIAVGHDGYTCPTHHLGAVFATSSCASGWGSGDAYYPAMPNGNKNGGYYQWCVPASCDVGSDGGVYGGVGPPPRNTDGEGCCNTWNQVGSYSYGGSTWDSYDGTHTGSRCNENYTALDGPPASPGQAGSDPPNMCDPGQVSCYDPKNNQACYTTESGEQICTKLDQADNCASGATGTVCYGKDGNDPPTPSDPPIPKDQPPDSTVQGSKSDSGGTENFTQNNYSGTSPGGADSSAGGSSGSQSNQNASGNSAGPVGDHGTDANGKCPDGSVPTASGCSGTATDMGCDQPPQAFGDAIMAAQFKELVAIRCNTQNAASGSSSGSDPTLADVPGALAAAGVPADGGASGDPDASSLVGTQEIGESGFDSVGLGLSRACPASPSFAFGGHTFTIDLTPFCNFLNLFGWLVLLASYLVGLRIVATGKA